MFNNRTIQYDLCLVTDNILKQSNPNLKNDFADILKPAQIGIFHLLLDTCFSLFLSLTLFNPPSVSYQATFIIHLFISIPLSCSP